MFTIEKQNVWLWEAALGPAGSAVKYTVYTLCNLPSMP